MFDAEKDKVPLFKVMCHYMRMVIEMMSFIRAVRSGDWAPHLEALEVFTKYFFRTGHVQLRPYDSCLPCGDADVA